MALPLRSWPASLVWGAIILCSFSSTTVQLLVGCTTLRDLYAQARHTRIFHGHAAAQPLYANLLLQQQGMDRTTATRLAGASGKALRLWQTACSYPHDTNQQRNTQLAQLKSWFLAQDFTTAGVRLVLGIPPSQAAARAPVYVTPAAPGTVTENNYPFPSAKISQCQCLVALFLLGLAVPVASMEEACGGSSRDKLELLCSLGLVCRCEHDDSLLIAVVSIMPVDLTADEESRHLYVVTDWHPRALNAIQITDEEEAVMYIGPDSLALVQHWMLHPDLPTSSSSSSSSRGADKNALSSSPSSSSRGADKKALLDLCTGSGIQTLASLSLGKCHSAVCVDLNPRALRFTAFSAALNGLNDDNSVALVLGNLLDGTGRVVGHPKATDTDVPLEDLLLGLLGSSSALGYDMITANPPFLPVPAATNTAEKTVPAVNDALATRHGLFSAGGSSGEAVLASILALSQRILKPSGYAALVSEFFFQNESSIAIDLLLDRLRSYWSEDSAGPMMTDSSKALLFTNQFPISAQLYAERRADSPTETSGWMEHLQRENIATCSPGLLYIQQGAATENDHVAVWKHAIVPKSDRGSIWTPANPEGERFTQETSRDFFSKGTC